jgi:hypothetical protein
VVYHVMWTKSRVAAVQPNHYSQCAVPASDFHLQGPIICNEQVFPMPWAYLCSHRYAQPCHSWSP